MKMTHFALLALAGFFTSCCRTTVHEDRCGYGYYGPYPGGVYEEKIYDDHYRYFDNRHNHHH